jgi:hypothetical protein
MRMAKPSSIPRSAPRSTRSPSTASTRWPITCPSRRSPRSTCTART